MEYMYYGRSDGVKPSIGVTYLMIDEHIERIIKRAKAKHDKELEITRHELKSEVKEMLSPIKNHIAEIKKDLAKFKKDFLIQEKKNNNDKVD